MLELEDVEERDVTGQRWVMHRQQRPVPRRLPELPGEPLQLRRVEVAVVPAGHARVQGDQPQPVEVPDAGDRLLGGGELQEALSQGRALIMVACDPDDDRAELGRDRLDGIAQTTIGLGLAQIGEVAGDHDRCGVRVDRFDRFESSCEVGLDVVPAGESGSAGEEMRVADVDDHVGCRLVTTEDMGLLREMDHGISLGPLRRACETTPAVVTTIGCRPWPRTRPDGAASPMPDLRCSRVRVPAD